MKQILSEIVDRMSDTAASLDAMELALVESGILRKDTVRIRFRGHKETVESHLVVLRAQIAALKD
jgi:hypothetical protein